MARVATTLYRTRSKPCRVSPFVLMSDPVRLPHLVEAVRKLPTGATLIYRHFGKKDRRAEAKHLRTITFEHAQQFLIGNDPELAIEVGADGVHFKRDAQLKNPTLWRKRCPDWLITMAGVKDGTPYTNDLTILDGLIVSSIFESDSPTSGTAIEVSTLTQTCETLPVSVFALGGINVNTAQALIGSGAAGLAGVSGLS